MSGVINKHMKLSSLFNSLETLCEVYTDLDFKLEDNFNVNFYLLAEHELNVAKVLIELNKLYGNTVSVYVTFNPYDLALRDRKIVWRKGVWYI